MLGKPLWKDRAALEQLNRRSSEKIPWWSCQSMSWTRPWLSRSGTGDGPHLSGFDHTSPGASLHFAYSCRVFELRKLLLFLQVPAQQPPSPDLEFPMYCYTKIKILIKNHVSKKSKCRKSLRALQETTQMEVRVTSQHF